MQLGEQLLRDFQVLSSQLCLEVWDAGDDWQSTGILENLRQAAPQWVLRRAF